MNVLGIGAGGLLALLLGYRFYARHLEKRLIQPSEGPTPATTFEDGVDYVPAPRPVLFGHHFASIAGAGPIVGPLLGALYFGWLPAVLWVVIGAVFMGAVHDYTALMISVRHEGRSLADVADSVLGARVRWLFSIFLWLTLVLVVAIFALVTAATLIKAPGIVVPTFGLLAVASAFGWAVKRRGVPVWLGTSLALAALVGLVWLGDMWPLALPDAWLQNQVGLSAKQVWFLILLAYAFLASVLPVWSLLQPRDYLSTWVLYAGLVLGFLGLIYTHPTIQIPAFNGMVHESKGALWPVLFITIACGAISGFHSVVAAGTSSKQLAREGHGRLVGYGAMIMEAILALMVILIAGSALSWDPGLQDQRLGYQFLMNTKEGGPGPIGTFATAFGAVVGRLPGLSVAAGFTFGMLMLNTFVLTSLDTSTRLARFILGELAPKRGAWVANRFVATSLTIAAAMAFGLTGSYQKIWPVFGASNQLIAALALIVATAWFLSRGLPRAYTLLPGLFMLGTTTAALGLQCYAALVEGQDFLIAGVSFLLLVLAGFIFYEARGILHPGRSDREVLSK